MIGLNIQFDLTPTSVLIVASNLTRRALVTQNRHPKWSLVLFITFDHFDEFAPKIEVRHCQAENGSRDEHMGVVVNEKLIKTNEHDKQQRENSHPRRHHRTPRGYIVGQIVHGSKRAYCRNYAVTSIGPVFEPVPKGPWITPISSCFGWINWRGFILE